MQLNVHVKSSGALTIGEVADRFGVATHVLRHWESMGLLGPRRDGGGQRRYDEQDLRRVALIQMGKQAGFGLRDLRALLRTGNPMDRSDLLKRHAAELADHIARATMTKELIEHALACPTPFDECPHAQAAIDAWLPAPSRRVGSRAGSRAG